MFLTSYNFESQSYYWGFCCLHPENTFSLDLSPWKIFLLELVCNELLWSYGKLLFFQVDVLKNQNKIGYFLMKIVFNSSFGFVYGKLSCCFSFYCY